MFEDFHKAMIALCTSVLVLRFGFSDSSDGLTKALVGENYLNEWAAEIPGGARVAKDIADKYDFTVVRAFRSLPDHYLLQRKDTSQRSRRSSEHHTRSLTEDHRVVFAEQQQHLTRVKRTMSNRYSARNVFVRSGNLDDPEFSHQWYIDPVAFKSWRTSTSRNDLRVREVWRKGITGKNVVITIIDDGLEINHPDLRDNYDPLASYDIVDHDDDPTPRYDATNENKHGTRCAGVVAMIANNNICGVGIAFDSKIGGIRLLDTKITDQKEADSLAFKQEYIDIYSASWGPSDDGKTVDGPRKFAHKALRNGITKGRDGKGTLYVWASGNGGYVDDNCNTDGYNIAIETISVSSCTQRGREPFYAEKCASTITTAYSSGTFNEEKVVSTDIRHKCTDRHTGTSASAPMVAGILALLLENNPNVTWRDVQHILIHSSRMEPLASSNGWYRNAAGYCVNLSFGFGLIDALAAVELGDPNVWKNVDEQRICTVKSVFDGFPVEFHSGKTIEIPFKTDACSGQNNEINSLEHVKVIVDLDYSRRGNVYIELVSAMGTVTPLLLERRRDASTEGFKHWPFMSTHTWGEDPRGTWIVRITDRSNNKFKGKLKGVIIVLHGTQTTPEYRTIKLHSCGVHLNLTNTGSVRNSIPRHKLRYHQH